MAPEDCDRLSDDDARILGLESATITGHTLKLIVLEPGAGPLELDALRAAVARRLPREPRATQRVDTSGSEPRWVDATDFDICHHVRRWANPDCVSQADLWRAVSGVMSEHLDRERPLWVLDVIGPLGDGRVAIAARIHHAMADGIAGVRFLEAVLWDAHLDPRELQDPLEDPKERPRPGLRSAPAAVRSRLADAWGMPGAVLRELGHPGSRSPFDRPITASRELAFLVAPLADVKAIGASRPTRTTVNDVLLAIVAGGLRTWLGVGQTAAPHLHAQVPVSLHHRDEGASDLGNRDSFINVDNAVQRVAKSAREFSVSISNVPGPPSPITVAGRKVQHLFSSSEPAAHHALRISAISCAGDIGIGLCTDPQALPDVARLAVAIENSYTELRSAAMETNEQ